MLHFHDKNKKETQSKAATNSPHFQQDGIASCMPPQFKATAGPISQMKENGEEKEEALQKKENNNCSARAAKQFKAYQPSVQKKVIKQFKQHKPFQLKESPANQKSQNGLPQEVQAKMENSMGHDFSNVNIHQNSKNATDAGALAYAQGNDVHFAPGQFKPDTTSGQELIGHELAHVVQQREGRVKPTKLLGKGMPVNDDPGLEKEADDMGRKAVQGKTSRNKFRGSEDKSQSMQLKPDGKIDEALKYYKETKSGQKTKWTPGLIEELYKVVGTANKSLYETALASGKIDASFVVLVFKVQEVLGIEGDGIDGKIGSATKRKWDKWKTGGKKGIDYNELFKDKKLEIGVAVGYEFHDTEFIAIEKLLRDEGLALSDNSASKKIYKGKKKFKVQGDNTAAPVEIEIIVDCISEKSTGAKNSYAEFLTQKEISIYSGHARYGTGPDFDDSKSVSENFVIGVNSALHKAGKLTPGYNSKKNALLKGKANDLEALSKAGKFDPDLYQVWFMNACSSINYLDEVRNGLVTDKDGNVKSTEKLRFMGTKHAIVSDAKSILKGVLNMQTMEEIIAIMDKEEKLKNTKPKSNYYFAD